MTTEPQELEVALLIAADTAPVVAASIARATHLAGYELAPRDDQRLHDIMYDTATDALHHKGFALRTRLRNGSRLVTLKGAAERDEHDNVSRTELELPWSAASFQSVVRALAAAGIMLDQPAAFDDTAPASTMRAAGLLPVQDRQTRRQVRDVLQPRGNGHPAASAHAAAAPRPDQPLAELAIDAVEYRLGAASIEIYEIEIEAKQPGSAAVLHSCALALQTDFGAMLRPWPYGKLATGAAIERLLRSGEITPLLVDACLVGAQAALLLEDRLRV